MPVLVVAFTLLKAWRTLNARGLNQCLVGLNLGPVASNVTIAFDQEFRMISMPIRRRVHKFNISWADTSGGCGLFFVRGSAGRDVQRLWVVVRGLAGRDVWCSTEAQ